MGSNPRRLGSYINPDGGIALLLERLDEYARRKDTVGYEEKIDALGHLLAAERRRLLPHDNYSGLMIQKIVGNTLVNDMVSRL